MPAKKIKILGRAILIAIAVAMADIELLSTYKPEALILRDEDGNPLFAIAKSKRADISKSGVAFNDVDKDGFACITVAIPDDVAEADRKKFVRDQFGPVIHYLEVFAPLVTAEAAQLRADLDAVEDNIEVQ